MNTKSRLAALVAVVAAACLLAACGSASSSSSTSSSSAAASTGRGTAARSKLVACLKQHGVTLPSRPAGSRPPGGGTNGSGGGPPAGGFGGGGGFFGGGGGGGFRGRFQNNPKLQAAFKACGANFGFARRRFNPAQRKTEINNFVKCVRQHGYNLPTPNLSGSAAVFPRSIESNKKFEAAARSCASILRPPGGPPPGGQSTTASSTA